MIEKHHGRAIRKIRKLQGFAQVELANQVGISYMLMNSIECGRRLPTLPVLAKIMNVLGWGYAQYVIDPSHTDDDFAMLQSLTKSYPMNNIVKEA